MVTHKVTHFIVMAGTHHRAAAVYCSFLVPLWTVAMNAVTRVLEFRADRYSVALGYDIRPSPPRSRLRPCRPGKEGSMD